MDRHLKRLAESDCPIQLILHKKTVQLVYDQGYSEPYLLFVFWSNHPRFVYWKSAIKWTLRAEVRSFYARAIEKVVWRVPPFFSYKSTDLWFRKKSKISAVLLLKDFPHFCRWWRAVLSEMFIQLLKQRKDPAEIEILGDSRTLFFELFPELLFRGADFANKENYLAILRLSCNQITESGGNG